MKSEFDSLQDYLEERQANGLYWFSRRDALTKLGFTSNAFTKAALRLANKGKLSRIRGDFFTLIPLEYRATGALPASWFIDALMQYLQQAYYVALLSAASLHEAAHQQPMEFQVITDKQTRPIKIANLQIKFFYKKKINAHFYQNRKTATGFMQIATPEITALDLVYYANAAGHINHVATVLCELIEKISVERLSWLIDNGHANLATIQRLGYLLDFLKLPITLTPLENFLSTKKLDYHLLVPSSQQPIIARDRRWKILINETVEPDEL